MPKRFSLILAAILAVVLMAGPAYPQSRVETSIQLLQADVIALQSKVDDLTRTMTTRNNNLQTLLERMVDKVNVMGSEVQNGVQTAVQNGVQSNAQANQANADRLARMIEELKAENDRSDKAVAASIAALNGDIVKIQTSLLNTVAEKVNEGIDRLGAQFTKSNTDQLTQIIEKLDKLNGSLGDKITQNSNGLQLQINAVNDRLDKMASTPVAVKMPTAEEELRRASADCLLGAGAYSFCLEEINDLLGKFPQHSVAPRAKLLRADIFYNQAKWDQAFLYYDELFQKEQDTDIKRVALLKRGLSEEKLKQTAKAKETAERVLSEFPGPSAEALAAEELIKRLTPPPPPPTPEPPQAPTPAPPPARGSTGAAPARGGSSAAPARGGAVTTSGRG